ncbi:MAG: hypothetical protein ACT4NX_05455 [Deltaproteobacteria bacterium]
MQIRAEFLTKSVLVSAFVFISALTRISDGEDAGILAGLKFGIAPLAAAQTSFENASDYMLLAQKTVSHKAQHRDSAPDNPHGGDSFPPVLLALADSKPSEAEAIAEETEFISAQEDEAEFTLPQEAVEAAATPLAKQDNTESSPDERVSDGFNTPALVVESEEGEIEYGQTPDLYVQGQSGVFYNPDSHSFGSVVLAQSTLDEELLRRRDAEESIKEEIPLQKAPGRQPSTQDPSQSEEDIIKQGDIDENAETVPPLFEEEFIPDRSAKSILDRWRLLYNRNLIDPYNQNVLKGDYPVIGDEIFFSFTGISDTLFEFREIPTIVGPSAGSSGSFGFFGKDNQAFLRHNLLLRFELFKGATAFKPLDWSINAVLAINLPEYLKVQETGVVNANFTNGTSRTTGDIRLQELSYEYHLKDISDRYDFISAEVGIQPFNLDFRGFVFLDTNLGARFFGTYDNNRFQYNVAFFDQLEKDTTSEFNTLERRDQQILLANIYREDFIWLGYTTQFSLLYTHDDGNVKFDDNRFLVRPDVVGDAQPRDLDILYFGWTSNGHIGTINVNHAAYLAIGKDDRNPLAGRETNIFGHMAALELSRDFDWYRPKVSVFYSSGDNSPTSGTASGFDTILDKPNFSGGAFSFWNRQGIRLLGVGLNQRESLVPSLRSSKIEGQPNFVNPGIFIANVGLDVETTPKLRTFFNINYLRFVHTNPLEDFLDQPNIRNDIGFDLSMGFFYRPLLTNNIILTGGVATLLPGEGFKDILTDNNLFQAFMNVIFEF